MKCRFARRIGLRSGWIVGAMLLMAAAPPAGGAGARDETTAAPAAKVPDEIEGREVPTLLGMSKDQAARLSPLLQEIRTILIGERAQVAALTEEFAKARDSREALRILHRIEDVKYEAEVGTLQARARAARTAGHAVEAERLEEAVRLRAEARRGRSSVGGGGD